MTVQRVLFAMRKTSKRSCISSPGRRTATLFIMLTAFAAPSCNSLRVYVTNTTPPDFTFNAGEFAECCTHFNVFAVFEEGSEKPFWRIASKKRVERTEANSMVIHYGKLPNGFEQEIPVAGEPPQLAEGNVYVAVAGGTDYVPWARVRFAVKDNKIVSLPARR